MLSAPRLNDSVLHMIFSTTSIHRYGRKRDTGWTFAEGNAIIESHVSHVAGMPLYRNQNLRFFFAGAFAFSSKSRFN